MQMKKVNSFILPDDVIKDMKNKIKYTRKQKIELGFALCKDRDTKTITKGTECVGTKCAIKVGKCPEDKTYLGNYHTHPRSYASMSIIDMMTGCTEEIECIGSVPYNSIRCFIRKTGKSSCFRSVAPFEDTEHKILESKEKIIESIKHLNIIELIKNIGQYNEDFARYESNRLKLLKQNFDRTNIT